MVHARDRVRSQPLSSASRPGPNIALAAKVSDIERPCGVAFCRVFIFGFRSSHWPDSASPRATDSCASMSTMATTRETRVIELLTAQLPLLAAMAKTLDRISSKLDKLDDVADRVADVKDSVIDAKVAIDDVKFAVDDAKAVVANVEEAVDATTAEIAKTHQLLLMELDQIDSRHRALTLHDKSPELEYTNAHPAAEKQCAATTSRGSRCRFPADGPDGLCLTHGSV